MTVSQSICKNLNKTRKEKLKWNYIILFLKRDNAYDIAESKIHISDSYLIHFTYDHFKYK